jgi:hypothetical protein
LVRSRSLSHSTKSDFVFCPTILILKVVLVRGTKMGSFSFKKKPIGVLVKDGKWWKSGCSNGSP